MSRNKPCFHPSCIKSGTRANFENNDCWLGLDKIFCCPECKVDYIKNYKADIQKTKERRRTKVKYNVELHRQRRKLAIAICDLLYQLADIELDEKVAMDLVKILNLFSTLFLSRNSL
jgi:hypothetical protein